MTYDPRAAYLARINATASQEDGLVKENDENVVAGTASASEQTVVDATDKTEVGKLATETGAGTTSQEEISSLPEQKEGSDNIAETEKGNKVSTIDPEMPTDAEDFPESPVEAYDSSETPEKLAAGVVSSVKTLEEGVTQVENDISAVRELENVATEMRAIIAAKGAMTSAEARMVQVAVDNALRKTDVDADMASMEAFDASSTAAYASDVSLEGVGDAINKGIARAIFGLEKGVKDLLGLANSVTPLLNRYKSRAEAIRKQINTSNREAGLKTIKDEDICIALSVDGKTPDANTVLKTAKYLELVLKDLYGDKTITTPIAYLQTVVKEISSVNSVAAGEALVGKFPKFFTMFPNIAKVSHPLDGEAGKALNGKRSLPLFGDEVIVVTEVNPKTDIHTLNNHLPGVYIQSSGKWSGSDEIQTLTSKQQSELADTVIRSADLVIGYYKNFTARSKALQSVMNEAFDKTRNIQVEEGTDPKFAKAVEYVTMWAARSSYKGLFGGQGKIARHTAVTLDGLIDYVEKSRKATQADDKDPAKAAENRAAVED